VWESTVANGSLSSFCPYCSYRPGDHDSETQARPTVLDAADRNAEMHAVLDDLHLAPIGAVDLLSQDESEEVSLLPSARAKTGLAALFARNSTWKVGPSKTGKVGPSKTGLATSFARNSTWKVGPSEHSAFERRLLIVCAVLGVQVIGLLVFIVLGG
jgi:hypothetical protein